MLAPLFPGVREVPTNAQRLSGMIAFSAGPFENGTTDIYTVRADGSELRRLTGDTGRKFDPALSPDGRKIVFRFQKGDDRTAEIYLTHEVPRSSP